MDQEEEHDIANEQPDEEPKPKKMPGRGVMTPKKEESLKKARAALKAKSLEPKKYSEANRSAAEKRIEEELNKRADALALQKAEELLVKRKHEAEMQEYNAWKEANEKEIQEVMALTKKAKKGKKVKVVETSSEDSSSEEEEPVKKKKKKAPVKKAPKKKAPEPEEQQYYNQNIYTSAYDMNEFLD